MLYLSCAHLKVCVCCFSRSVKGRGCTSRCIFSGSRGEVCAIEPLHIPKEAKNPVNSQTMLVAMVTFTKVSKHTLTCK